MFHKDQKPFYIELENFSNPRFVNHVKNNAILNQKDEKNIFLISPTGSGKTNHLSALYSLIGFFANLGGCLPAKKAEFVYCNKFFIGIKNDYVIGAGSSGYMNDIQMLNTFQQACSESDDPCLVIFDEIFEGKTHFGEATRMTIKKLEYFMTQPHILLLSATHNPALKFVAESENFKTVIWYSLVVEVTPGEFVPTYHLCRDFGPSSEFNWWFSKDDLKRQRYSDWLEKQMGY